MCVSEVLPSVERRVLEPSPETMADVWTGLGLPQRNGSGGAARLGVHRGIHETPTKEWGLAATTNAVLHTSSLQSQTLGPEFDLQQPVFCRYAQRVPWIAVGKSVFGQ